MPKDHGIPHRIYSEAFKFINNGNCRAFHIYQRFKGKFNSQRNKFCREPYTPLEAFRHVFVEFRDFDTDLIGTMRIFHNCDPGGGRYGISFYSGISEWDEEYKKDYLEIDEDSFSFLYRSFRTVYPEFDCYDTLNPFKVGTLNRVYRRVEIIKEDLRNENRDSDLLKNDLNSVSLYCLNNELGSIYTWDESLNKNVKDVNAYWNFIFKHKQKIIDFYDAFFWYIYKYRKFGDGVILNISGF